MKLTFRWYGEKDSIPLQYIREIPNMSGVVTAVYDVPVGEVWPKEDLAKLKKISESAGLELEVIDSIPVHEDIKLGLPSRKEYIENYKKTLVNLGTAGIHMVCYNFMPVFDWTRTDLAQPLADGSNALGYNQAVIDKTTPESMFDRIDSNSNGFLLPGWEL